MLRRRSQRRGAADLAAGGAAVMLQTSDGVALRGRWHDAHDAWASAVVAHGFSAGVDDPGVRSLTGRLTAAGYNVLSYDARGHGQSGGSCAVGAEEHLDVAAAVREVVGRGLPVVLIGVSMGSIAVVRYLSAGAAAGVAGAVLVSGPARWRMRPSAVGIATAVVTKTLAGRWAARHWFRVRVASHWRVGETPESMLARVRQPVAIVHGAGDRLLAASHASRLRRSAGGPVSLHVVDGMGHGLDGAGVITAAEAAGWVLERAAGAALLARTG